MDTHPEKVSRREAGNPPDGGLSCAAMMNEAVLIRKQIMNKQLLPGFSHGLFSGLGPVVNISSP
jgi:hypothetical protein